ncbi:MAG TPA: translocation/assembly module TamB domain-containing protein, partial [Longimicrobiales bacterium]|nr:translocation/assembly module TamB domain-containing protein [Longimicrobiales bacterium]
EEDDAEPRASIARFERAIERGLDRHSVPLRPLQGALRVTLGDVRWRDDAGRPFLRADLVRGAVNARALQGGQLVASDVLLRRPRVLLVRGSPEGPWNWESLIGGDGGRAGRAGGRAAGALAVVRNAVIEQGHVEMRLPEGTWEFRDLDARIARTDVPRDAPPIAVVRVERLTTTVIRPDTLPPMRVAVDNATVRVLEETVPFEAERVAIDGGVFEGARGTWEPAGPGFGVTATVERGDVRFAELRGLFPTLPEQGRAGFALEIEPTAEGGTRFRLTGLDFVSGGSEVQGFLAGVLGPQGGVTIGEVDLRLEPLDLALLEPYVETLPFLGTLRGRVEGTRAALRYDLAANLRGGRLAEPVDARLTGTASLADGFALRSLAADLDDVPLEVLRAFAPGLPLTGRISGRISLEGTPGESPLTLNVRLELATGVAVVTGRIDLRGDVPSYDLSGRLIDVRLAELAAVPIPPLEFTGAFDLEGRGTDPSTLTADVHMSGRLTGWETEPGDSLVLNGRFAGGALTLDTLRVAAGPAALAAGGRWAFTGEVGGAIRYSLRIDDLRPLAPYLPMLPDTTAEGALTAEGTLTGTLAAPRLAGELAIDQLEMRSWRVDEARATYALDLARPLPLLELEASARRIRTAAGTYTEATLSVDLQRPDFRAELSALRDDGGEIDFATEGRLMAAGGEEPGQALVQRFRVDLRDQSWALAAPARIRWGGVDGVVIDSLVVRQRDGEGHIALDGRIFSEDAADLDLRVQGFPIGEALRLAGVDTDLSGPLFADLDVRGTRGSPLVDGRFRLEAGDLRGVSYEGLEGTLSYAAQRLTVDAHAILAEPSGRLDVEATLPVLISLDSVGFRLLDDQPLSARVQAEELPLEGFSGLIPQLRDMAGSLTMDARVAGTFADPEMTGSARLTDGAATVIPLDRRFEEAAAEIALEGSDLHIRSFQVRSGGWARGSGTVTLDAQGGPTVDAELELDGFEAIQFGKANAVEATGTLTLAGPVSEPVVRGDVHLEDGTIRLPKAGAASAFEAELTRVQTREPVSLESFAGVAPRPAFAGVRLSNVRVSVGDDVWFEAEDARAQLSGDLVVSGSQDGVQLRGTLRGERGTFILRAGPVIRRFDVVQASVRFFGLPTPNPALDITASRTVPVETGRVEVLVRVGGTLERPTVSLATAGGETASEAQLLSFLLFGQPGVGFGGGSVPGEQILEQAFFGGLGDIAAIQLEEAIISELGVPFDIFQIRLGGTDAFGLSAPTIVLGKEIADDVFLTVDAGVASLFGGGETTASLWAVTLEWRIDDEWTAELGIEPLHRWRTMRLRTLAPVLRPRQEFFAELRRRWTY